MKEQNKIKDVKLDQETWKQLSKYKIDGGFRSLAEVIKHLLNKE